MVWINSGDSTLGVDSPGAFGFAVGTPVSPRSMALATLPASSIRKTVRMRGAAPWSMDMILLSSDLIFQNHKGILLGALRGPLLQPFLSPISFPWPCLNALPARRLGFTSTQVWGGL